MFENVLKSSIQFFLEKYLMKKIELKKNLIKLTIVTIDFFEISK